jgi:hypothetical protein
MGYLKFKLAERGKTISYCESVLSALNALNFGGQLTKVVSKQGKGYVWAVVRDKQPDVIAKSEDDITTPSPNKILEVQTNIALMRGKEDDEGID